MSARIFFAGEAIFKGRRGQALGNVKFGWLEMAVKGSDLSSPKGGLVAGRT